MSTDSRPRQNEGWHLSRRGSKQVIHGLTPWGTRQPVCWLLLIVGLLAAAAFPGGSVALAAAHTSEALPCGVDAVVGMARILGQETDAATVAELAADYAAPRLMSVLEVAREVHALTGVKPQVVEASFDELMWLDRPHIVHLTSEECSECPGQGHAVAVERFAGEWAVTVGADGTHLLSASQLRRCYGGHAVMVMGPVAPALAFDSYLVVLPNVVAGLSRVCRVGLRNVGDGMLSIGSSATASQERWPRGIPGRLNSPSVPPIVWISLLIRARSSSTCIPMTLFVRVPQWLCDVRLWSRWL